MKDAALPDAGDIAALLDLLPGLERAGPSAGMPELVTRLVRLLYDHHFVLCGFPWMEWQEGRRFAEDPTLLAAVDLETICKLLTAHARSDRFVEGHLEAMVRSGHIAAILRRLREIQQARTQG